MKALTAAQRNTAPTAAMAEQRAALPTPLTDTRAAEIVLAADRFLSRPEIADCISNGSNGAVARLPASLDRRLDLFEAWPDASRCLTFAAQIDRALAEPARAADVAAAVAATIRLFPNGDRAGLGYAEGVAAFVTEEATSRGWSMAAVTGEATAQARAAAADATEAAQERARIGSVIKVGANSGKAKQAARLALTGPLDAVGARALLSTLPTDAAADPVALSIPTEVGAFGTSAAQAERQRIGAILASPEAEGRFAVAAAIATETTLDPAQAVSALLATPRAEARPMQSLAERSAAAGSFGPDFHNTAGMSKGERVDAMWSRAVHKANASIGAAPVPAADTPPANPFMNDAERAALQGAAGLAGGALTDLARG